MKQFTRRALAISLAVVGGAAAGAPAQAQGTTSLEQRVAILCSADMFRAHVEAVDVIERGSVIAVQVLGLTADAGADDDALVATAERVSRIIADYTTAATGFIDGVAADCIVFLAALGADPAFAEQVRTVHQQVVALVVAANETAQTNIEAELNRLLAGLP